MKRRNFTMSRSGIVNVRMVITEEKILSNISRVQKMIDPNSKKQIIQLEDDAYFKDLVESIKTYLIEYPKKKNFPASVYKAAYGLVEFATNEFAKQLYTTNLKSSLRSSAYLLFHRQCHEEPAQYESLLLHLESWCRK